MTHVGGLVGYVVNSIIAASYSTAAVTADDQVGGLVGYGNKTSILRASYARGDVMGDTAHSSRAGGLAGQFTGSISSSYATGNVTGTAYVGGLVGGPVGPSSSSYYLLGATITDTNGAVPPAVCARSSAHLAAITTASDTAWGVDIDGNILSGGDSAIVWDFVTNADDDAYPVLCSVDTDGDGRFTSLEFVADMAELDALKLPFSEVGFRQATATVSEGDAPVSFFIDAYVPVGSPALTYSYSISVDDSTADIVDDYTIDLS